MLECLGKNIENRFDDFPVGRVSCLSKFCNLVFRCAALLAIVLRVLQASLAASRSQLSRHILDKPLVPGKTGQLSSESEREELKSALIATQESIAVQVLLEACLPTSDDEVGTVF